MRKMIIFFMSLAILTRGVELTKDVFPELPEMMMLSDGFVIKKGVVKKCGPELVTITGASGLKSVRYEAFPDDVRSQLEKFRPGGPRWFPGDTGGSTLNIEGQIFIQTQGSSSYKFGNVTVYAFDLNLLSNFSAPGTVVRLQKPIHQAETDADGKFTIKVPKGRAYFIFAQASRFVAAGVDSYTQNFEWRVPMSAVRKGQLLKMSADYRYPSSQVEIEPQT